MGHSVYEIMKLLQQWPAAARETAASKTASKPKH